MTNRERFKRIMNFKSVDRYLNIEWGAWGETITRWEDEGLPENIYSDTAMHKRNNYFGLDARLQFKLDIIRPYPFIEKKTISEDEKYEVYTDEVGITRKRLKGISQGMDQFLEYPVKDRDDWKKWKKKFQSHYEKRYPSNWETKVADLKNRTDIVECPTAGQVGFYSFLRNFFGTKGASYILYDDPSLVEEIIEFLVEYFIGVLSNIVKNFEIDIFMYFEDMAFKTGPLISPDMVKKFFSPGYKKINSYLKDNGVTSIFLDSDGNIEQLLPTLIESGIEGIVPLEVNAGMDVVKLRKEYGKDLLMIGGINKMALAKDKKAIEAELQNNIIPILGKGGYLPTVDHSVPPDVSLDNFLYYLELKKRMLEGTHV